MAKLYRVTLTYAAASVAMENVLYMSDPSRTAQQMCEYLSTDVGGECFVKWIAKCTLTGTEFTQVQAQEVGHLLLDPDFYQRSITIGGTRTGTDTDPQLAVCVSLHTGLSGRKRRGRFFIGGVSTSDTALGKLSSGAQAVFQSNLNSAKALVDGSGSLPTWNVFSRTIFGGLTDIILDSYKPVTSVVPQLVLSTMRSRSPR